DGIRDGHVTGVQTCALPICASAAPPIFHFAEIVGEIQTSGTNKRSSIRVWAANANPAPARAPFPVANPHMPRTAMRAADMSVPRSEERRVGKESRYRWAPCE